MLYVKCEFRGLVLNCLKCVLEINSGIFLDKIPLNVMK